MPSPSLLVLSLMFRVQSSSRAVAQLPSSLQCPVVASGESYTPQVIDYQLLILPHFFRFSTRKPECRMLPGVLPGAPVWLYWDFDWCLIDLPGLLTRQRRWLVKAGITEWLLESCGPRSHTVKRHSYWAEDLKLYSYWYRPTRERGAHYVFGRSVIFCRYLYVLWSIAIPSDAVVPGTVQCTTEPSVSW